MNATTTALEGNELFAQLKANYYAGVIKWVETTEEVYHEQLGMLPPMRQVWGGFLGGEPATHNEDGEAVYACFTCRGNKYEACRLTINQFKQLVG